MTCEVRNNGNEVVLRDPSIKDVLALASLMIHPDRELVFSKPQELRDENDS